MVCRARYEREATWANSSTYQWVVEAGVAIGFRRAITIVVEARGAQVAPDLRRALEETEDPLSLEEAVAAAFEASGPDATVTAILRVLRPTSRS